MNLFPTLSGRLSGLLSVLFAVLALALSFHTGCSLEAGGVVALTGMAFVAHARNIKDAKWEFTKAFPAAGAQAVFTAIDLENVAPGRDPDWECEIEFPATPSLVDAKTIIARAYTTAGAADSLAGLDPIAQLTVTGAGGVGAATAFVRFALPSTAKQFLRVTLDVLAAGGDSTALSATTRLLF